VEEHQAFCQPRQKELVEVEQRLAGCMADRRPIDPADEARRVELAREITEANERLEVETTLVAKLKRPIAAEVQRLRGRSGEVQVLRRRLTIPPLANPELVLAQFAAEMRERWNAASRREAEEKIELARSGLAMAQAEDNPRAVAIYQARIEKWQAAMSGKDEGRSQQELYRLLLNE
jgi:hypothetical protein